MCPENLINEDDVGKCSFRIFVVLLILKCLNIAWLLSKRLR